MCNFRRVSDYFPRCEHVIARPEEYIQCNSRYCKFSPQHPNNCTGDQCKCLKSRQYPETYQLRKEGTCPSCTAQGFT
ncbi:hypothetical protein CPB83DRAFT_854738 [Crepidotus variabilis]|uniref:Uncharacterized protein n=1 Tax=Crepidotus variabilis TaxID=179855 RepID=A0A9P6EG45_9AGAR|nr:hypothetical protein CPB83DRAFT_854738 [Crepidotus variabilis]